MADFIIDLIVLACAFMGGYGWAVRQDQREREWRKALDPWRIFRRSTTDEPTGGEDG